MGATPPGNLGVGSAIYERLQAKKSADPTTEEVRRATLKPGRKVLQQSKAIRSHEGGFARGLGWATRDVTSRTRISIARFGGSRLQRVL